MNDDYVTVALVIWKALARTVCFMVMTLLIHRRIYHEKSEINNYYS